MKTLRFILWMLLLISTSNTYAQKKFKVVVTETDNWRNIYSFVDENGKLIRQLDTAKYLMCFNPDVYVYFAIFGVKGNMGWPAINAEEKLLFNVYNTSFGEPSPDYLVENTIRTVDENNLIGFADDKGNLIIKPQFEIATSFHKDKAIVGKNCKKVPWSVHDGESGCEHYSITCQQHGYINKKGKLIKIGNYNFEQIQQEINWQPPEDLW